MKNKLFTALGVMTGTSMDGVDISLIESDGVLNYTHILDNYFEFDPNLQVKLIKLREKVSTHSDLDKNLKEIIEIEKEFTLFIGQKLNKVINTYEKKIDLIGFHGQTIFHDSDKKISKQLGDGKLLSQLTKKIVVNRFRDQDLANGGQGAPLTPIFHSLISKILDKKFNLGYPLSIINIGGITNITQIINEYDVRGRNLYAYDIGPGNCLIDEWVKKNSTSKLDKDGEISRSGKVDNFIFNQALDNFELKTFNRSLDINDFDISFAKGLSLEDGCATITKFSASLISQGINKLNNSKSVKNLICGGGRKNKSLINYINENLNQKNELNKIDDYGFDGDFIESQAFAYLSIRAFLNLPNSFPNTTRCKSSTIGGTINKNF